MDNMVDLTGRTCAGFLVGSTILPPEVIVVGDARLADLYHLKPFGSSLARLKQHICEGAKSGDPGRMHLGYLSARDSESDTPDQPMGIFIIWTADMISDRLASLKPGTVGAGHAPAEGLMVSGVVASFAKFLNDADTGLLIRLQGMHLASDGQLTMRRYDPSCSVLNREAIVARFLKQIADTWPRYQPPALLIARALAGDPLTTEESSALHSELWSIIQGRKPISRGFAYREPGQVRLLLDQCGNEIFTKVGEQINSFCSRWLAEKQQSYRGDGYLEQLEKNVIYLQEGTRAVVQAIAHYLFTGEPLLRPEEIQEFDLSVRTTRSLLTTPYHLAYLRNDCTGCPVHDEHYRYLGLRKMRVCGDLVKYIDELEFCCRYFQATYMIGQNYLMAFLNDHALAGSTQLIPDEELMQIINERVTLWANICIGNVQYRPIPPSNDGTSQSAISETKGKVSGQHWLRWFWNRGK
jgi:hypothetical protein